MQPHCFKPINLLTIRVQLTKQKANNGMYEIRYSLLLAACVIADCCSGSEFVTWAVVNFEVWTVQFDITRDYRKKANTVFGLSL